MLVSNECWCHSNNCGPDCSGGGVRPPGPLSLVFGGGGEQGRVRTGNGAVGEGGVRAVQCFAPREAVGQVWEERAHLMSSSGDDFGA